METWGVSVGSRGVGAGNPAGELAALDGETGAVGGIDGGAGVAVGGRAPMAVTLASVTWVSVPRRVRAWALLSLPV